jgi:signal transduction histidine kinase/HD-like signal output (HDOD) protein
MTTATSPARNVELILASLDQLPTLSPVASRVIRLSGASDEGFEEVIRLIESDVALTTKILSLCRRASLGTARSVNTVRRAAVMLGWDAVQSAVLSVQLYELLGQSAHARERRENTDPAKPATHASFDPDGFWRHAIAVACAAELLAPHARLNQARVVPEEAFVAGLIHDLGKLALDWVLPKSYARVVQHAEVRRIPLAQAERASIAIDHHQAGKHLAERWTLPLALQDVIWLHAQPPAAMPDVPHKALVGVVTLANALAKRAHLGWSPGGHDARAADQWAATLGITEHHIADVNTKLHDAVAQRCAMLGLGEASGQQLMVQSLTSANKRLAQLSGSLASVTRAAAEHARAVSAIADFAAAERPGGTVSDTLGRIAESFKNLAGRAPVAMIFQSRRPQPPAAPSGPFTHATQPPDDAWRITLLDDAAQPTSTELAPALTGADGEPCDLARLATSAELTDAARLMRWLASHDPDAHPTSQPHTPPAGSSRPERAHALAGVSLASAAAQLGLHRQRWARCAALGLVSPLGTAAVIIHDPEHPLPQGTITSAMTTFWAWALGAAAQGEGLRRLSESLSTSARDLAEARDRLAEHEALARLGEFTSGAAHELNNPLTVISGRAQVLADKLKGAKHEDDARAIVRAADAMTDLITQLHMVATPPASTPEPTDLGPWVEHALTEARRRTGVNSPVKIELPPDLEEQPAPILDAPALAKALTELLCNALQASPKTSASVRIQLIELTEPARATPTNYTNPTNPTNPAGPAATHALLIDVADDGRGMSDHARRHAFDPFFSDLPAGRRRGLGLPLARRVVQQAGGTIEIESVLGRGSRARVAIPMVKLAGGLVQAGHAPSASAPPAPRAAA